MAEATVSSPDPAAADAALLARLRAGDEAAFEEIGRASCRERV